MSDKPCEQMRPLLSGFLDGELDEGEAARVSGHLAACAGCRQYLADLERADQAVSALDAPRATPAYLDALAERVRARIAESAVPESERAPSHRGRDWSTWWRELTGWRLVTPVVAAAALAIVILRVVDMKLPEAVDRSAPRMVAAPGTELQMAASSPAPEVALAPDSVAESAELEIASGLAAAEFARRVPAPSIARSNGESWGGEAGLAAEAKRQRAALPAAPKPAPAPPPGGLGDFFVGADEDEVRGPAPEGNRETSPDVIELDEGVRPDKGPVAAAPEPSPPPAPPPPGPPPPPAVEEPRPPAQAPDFAAGAMSQSFEEKGQDDDQASAKRQAVVHHLSDRPATVEHLPGADQSSADHMADRDPAIRRARALLGERRFDEARVQLDSLVSEPLPETLSLESRELRLELAELTLGSPPDLEAERALATLAGRFADQWPEAAVAREWAASSVIHALEVYRRSGLAEDCALASERLAVFRERYAGDPEADSLTTRASRLGCGS